MPSFGGMDALLSSLVDGLGRPYHGAGRRRWCSRFYGEGRELTHVGDAASVLTSGDYRFGGPCCSFQHVVDSYGGLVDRHGRLRLSSSGGSAGSTIVPQYTDEVDRRHQPDDGDHPVGGCLGTPFSYDECKRRIQAGEADVPLMWREDSDEVKPVQRSRRMQHKDHIHEGPKEDQTGVEPFHMRDAIREKEAHSHRVKASSTAEQRQSNSEKVEGYRWTGPNKRLDKIADIIGCNRLTLLEKNEQYFHKNLSVGATIKKGTILRVDKQDVQERVDSGNEDAEKLKHIKLFDEHVLGENTTESRVIEILKSRTKNGMFQSVISKYNISNSIGMFKNSIAQ